MLGGYGGEVGEYRYFEGEDAAGRLVVGGQNVRAAVVVDVGDLAVETSAKRGIEHRGCRCERVRVKAIVHELLAVKLRRNDLQRSIAGEIKNAKEEVWP